MKESDLQELILNIKKSMDKYRRDKLNQFFNWKKFHEWLKENTAEKIREEIRKLMGN